MQKYRSLIAIAVAAVSAIIAAVVVYQFAQGPEVPITPKISDTQAIDIVIADLRSYGINTAGLKVFGAPVEAYANNTKELQLLYTTREGITYSVHTDTKTITRACTPEDDCSWGQREKLIYTLETNWKNVDSVGAENYVVDAMNGDILYKTTRPH